MGAVLIKPKIVVFTGAGVSAESGLLTFRDNGGLWHNHFIHDVATPEAWVRDPHLVLRLYNDQLADVQPNATHCALAGLEDKFSKGSESNGAYLCLSKHPSGRREY